MKKEFYHAFEERYRGSRELIKSRLRIYLPLIEPLKQFYQKSNAVDLGCGRGEWLELLSEAGIDAQGVDLDDNMLAVCEEKGFKVQKCDALAFLESLPDASQTVVSGFHVAEHIPFPYLQTLVEQALRVLNPGGLLILETPNPENIIVGTSSFYLDPTHQRPIPPQLLSFLPEYYGFERVKVLRVQEAKDINSEKPLTLIDIFNGVSPDYAVVAQKHGDTKLLETIKKSIDKEYGVTLENLTQQYDRQREARVQQAELRAVEAEANAALAESRARESEVRAIQAEASSRDAEARVAVAETHINDAQAQVEDLNAMFRVAERHINDAEARVNDLLHSTSWRITAPFRWVSSTLRSILAWLSNVPRHIKYASKKLLSRTAKIAQSRPRVRKAIRTIINRFPGVKRVLVRSLIEEQLPRSGSNNTATPDITSLTPRARLIYAKLRSGMQVNRGAS